MPEAKDRACPVCGLPVPSGAKRCENCGAKITKPKSRKEKPAAEREETTIREAPVAPKPPEAPSPTPAAPAPEVAGSSVLYLCPSCGAFVTGSATTCMKCGANLSVEAEEAHEESVESRLCPHCGSTVRMTDETCPACGKRIAPPAVAPPVEKPPAPGETACAECGAMVPASDAVCAICGTPREGGRPEPLAEERAPKEPVAEDFLDLEKDLALEPPKPVPAPPPEEEEARPSPEELFPELEEPKPRKPRPMPPPPPPLSKEAVEPERERELQKHLEDLLDLVEPEAQPPPAPGLEAPTTVAPRPRTRPVPRVARPAVRRPLPEVPVIARPVPISRATRIATMRDVAAIATAVALPVVAMTTLVVQPSPFAVGFNIGRLVLFGILFSLALRVVVAPDLRPVVRKRGRTASFVFGTAVLAVLPLFAMRQVEFGVTVLCAMAGAILVLLGAWPFRQTVGAFLPWLSGLLMLTILSVVGLAGELPPSSVETGLWVLGGILAIGPAALVPYRRGLRHFAEIALERADKAYQAQRYEEAIAAYDDAIDYGRRSGRELEAAWYGRGSALVALNRHQEALLALDRALGLNPNNEVAWVNKGTVLARTNQLPDALRCYNSAIKVNPNYEVAWNNKGNALARIGRHERSLQCYERALQIDPKYRTAWVNKGFVLAKLGRFEEAAQCAEEARRLTSEPTLPS